MRRERDEFHSCISLVTKRIVEVNHWHLNFQTLDKDPLVGRHVTVQVQYSRVANFPEALYFEMNTTLKFGGK